MENQNNESFFDDLDETTHTCRIKIKLSDNYSKEMENERLRPTLVNFDGVN